MNIEYRKPNRKLDKEKGDEDESKRKQEGNAWEECKHDNKKVCKKQQK